MEICLCGVYFSVFLIGMSGLVVFCDWYVCEYVQVNGKYIWYLVWQENVLVQFLGENEVSCGNKIYFDWKFKSF